MAEKNRAALNAQADEVIDETVKKANTNKRIGQFFKDISDSLFNKSDDSLSDDKVSVDSTGFNGNLSESEDTLRKVLAVIDAASAQTDATQAISDAASAQTDATQALLDAAAAQSTADSKGVVNAIVAGTNVTIDTTDPANPIVSSSGGGGSSPLDGYEILGGVIRKTATDTWDFIDDANHAKLHFSSIEVVNGNVRVHYDKTYSKVISFVVVGDEVTVAQGLMFGTSVGLSFTDINIRQNVTSSWITSTTTNNPFNVKPLGAGVTSCSWDAANNAAKIILENSEVKDMAYSVNVTSNNPLYRCIVGTVSTTFLEVKFVDNSGNLVTSKVAGLDFMFTLNRPALIDAGTFGFSSSHNLWLMGLMKI